MKAQKIKLEKLNMALFTAAQKDNPELILKLIKRGADPLFNQS